MLFLFTVSSVFTEDNPVIEVFSPQGIVKNVNQATARFSEQMVPFGSQAAPVQPFDIECSEKGTGRWVDGRNWVFDFGRTLPAGIECTFRLRSGIKTLSGKEIRGRQEFSFSTGGPSIINSMPYEDSYYTEEEQIFALILDAEPDESSILKNVFFSIEGTQDYTGIRIIGGKEREEILKSQFRYRRQPESQIVLIQCKQQFPSGAKISLLWGKGVKSRTGVANTNDQILRFKTREAFTADCSCERENAKSDCIPILPVSLDFSAPVPVEQAGKITLSSRDGKKWKPALSEDNDDTNTVSGLSFKGPFPENTEFKIEIPRGLKDDSGRSLVNADKFPLEVKTGKNPPLAKFAARFGILELKADPVLPVTLRSIEPEVKARMLQVGREGMLGNIFGRLLNVSSDAENIQEWLRRAGSAEREKSVFTNEKVSDFKIQKPSGPDAFEVVGIPLKDPGLYIVELESRILGESLLGKPAPMYVQTAVLVTNLSVHFKWGRESSIVWVTALNTGDPVKDADVAIRDCADKILWQGKTDANGTAKIEGKLPPAGTLPNCKYNSIGSGLFITAKSGDDFSFVFSSWNDGIETWRFNLPQDYYGDPAIAHTIFDRTLLRQGETVHMKHILRNHAMKGFSFLPADRMPDMLTIEHSGSEEKYEMPVKWDTYGIAESAFIIPKSAKLGTYRLTFQRKTRGSGRRYYNELSGGEFRVEEFRIPLLKGTIKPPAEPLIKARSLELDLNVRYLGGGGAGSLPVKLRSMVNRKDVASPEGFDDFTFANGEIKEGITRGGSYRYEEEYDEETPAVTGGKIPAQELTLDKSGGCRAQIDNLPESDNPQEILTELEFRDPNGELQTVSSRIPLWSSGYLIGIKPDSWALSSENFKFHAAVTDISGKPVADARVRIRLFTRKSYSHRKRLVGGFYAYEYMTEIKQVKELCEGKTDSRGLLICEAESPVSGSVILQAECKDSDGHKTSAHSEVWIAGKGEWWFDVSDNDRIDLLPEKKRYEPGETAVFQVRMPFRNATALITVEREGVIESWVQKLSGKQPVIKVPVKGSYAPNCFVSALVVRGRVSGVQPTAMADMGRPSYKLGISEIKVGWKAHELKVSVQPDRKIYRIREKANVKIKVTTADGSVLPTVWEAAVAAVDEGLLELMPNDSWNILQAMMGQRPYEVQTATAQMQVIGRRHFGLKALPQGGGGGRQVTRELFDTLLLWKGRVTLDKKGEASVTIPLNDSITGFRIVAVVNSGTCFGTGSASIQSTQDLMVLSGLPPLVREGDRFRAEFTIRNTTKRNMELEAMVKAEGITEELNPLTISLKSGESQEAAWDVLVPFGIQNLAWNAEVQEKGAKTRDSIKISQKVVPAVPERIYQAVTAQIDNDYSLFVEQPQDAVPGRGGVRIDLKPRLSGGQSGITDYMKNYPYTCMEQKISVSVALKNKDLWDKSISELNSYLDSDGLVKYFPTCQYGSPVLTSYIIAISSEAGWKIPDDSNEKMKTALKKFIEGSIIRYSLPETADLAIKKLSAVEALSRSGEAQVKFLDSISIEPNLWPTSAVIDWFSIMTNMKNYPGREDRIREAEQILRSRLNLQGSRLSFSTEGTDYLWWLMVSNDVNSVRLILSLINAGKWREDIPKIVLGALSRQYKGRWDLTTANAWGILALDRFSAAFESVPVSGETQALLSGQSAVTAWNTFPKGKTSFFSWPEKKEELSIKHQGSGKLWASIQSIAAIPLKEQLSCGYKIKKTIQPVEQKTSGQWTRGDIFRIKLEIEAQADQTWVAVSDPVPAGVTILGKGLARDSQILTQNEQSKGRAYPAFEERTFESFRAYYEYVPKGKWTVEYTIRINQSGRFQLPATRVEALYYPEMFGETPNDTVEIIQ